MPSLSYSLKHRCGKVREKPEVLELGEFKEEAPMIKAYITVLFLFMP